MAIARNALDTPQPLEDTPPIVGVRALCDFHDSPAVTSRLIDHTPHLLCARCIGTLRLWKRLTGPRRGPDSASQSDSQDKT